MTKLDDHAWMQKAIDLSRRCPPADSAFSVGAVIVDTDGNEVANGYSRETGLHTHAEESALAKLSGRVESLSDVTLYSTLEPCSERKSSPVTCTELILRSGIRRVVIAWREPALFVGDCVGVEILRANDVTVIELPELAGAARQINGHLLD
ncbi:deaminase [Streptomyces roseolilacinus]|uniref:CMP/dCMP-type deaminase domain-containing protein n=1 Tax=Streptomyces roseolilacinus TaxID=66904 RepID=A0A918AWG7_9ACTN|nr:deaminase [Streptomyces roseolilacinus]GGP91869.1 hypothetical protein GCM10010249_07380 [Streptomyces roseolilacinus]